MAEAAALPPWLQPLFANFVAALERGRLPHALLIHGPGGWGESVLADALALKLIGRDHTVGPPAAVVAHPDLRWLVPEGKGEQIKIDNVRNIAEFMVQTPRIAPCKVAVLAGAEAMNAHAANALLKTLEEPPQNSYLILVSDALSDLLPTLRSRCQLIAVRPTAGAALSRWLAERAPEKNADIVSALTFEYGGSPYRLLAALERDEQPIVSQLGDVATRRQEPLPLAKTWADTNSIETLERWMRYIPLVFAARHGADGARSNPLVAALAQAVDGRLLSFWEQLAEARGLLRGTTNPNARLLFETLLLDWRDLAQPL